MSKALFFVFVVSFFSTPIVHAAGSASIGSKAAFSLRLVSSSGFKGKSIQRASLKLVRNNKAPLPYHKTILKNENTWANLLKKTHESFYKKSFNKTGYSYLFKVTELLFEPVFIPDNFNPLQYYSSIIRPSVVQIE